jgi:hypothetical protein
VSHPILVRRRAEQQARIRCAADWARELAKRLDLVAVVVFGSSARGDFNKWSDIDVLVLAHGLPPDARARLALLTEAAPPGIQPVGWMPDEFADRRRHNDPIARECDTVGITVLGALPNQVARLTTQ